MKSINRFVVGIAAAFIVITAPLQAAVSIFSTAPGFTIDDIAFDDAGDLFYLQTPSDPGAPTVLIKRTLGSGYGVGTTVFDFGARKFGAFVTTTGGRVYFGESSDGSIRSIATDGSDPQLHANVPSIYSMAVSSSGKAYLSANGAGFGQGNLVLSLDLGLGTTTTLIDNTNDFSGPVTLDSSGNLYYGGTGSPFGPGAPGDIFRFSESALDNALATMTPIDLGSATAFASTVGNSYFAYASTLGIYRHAFGGLSLVDTTTGLETPVPGEPAPTLGGIAYNGSALYGVSTDFGAGVSTFSLIPEPSRALLILIGVNFALANRRRRTP
ncbi:MAG: PEP-CTERM sorting domain-containing protein [Verrucomicrobiales bacterium]